MLKINKIILIIIFSCCYFLKIFFVNVSKILNKNIKQKHIEYNESSGIFSFVSKFF